jgi:hypothetical protein
VKWYKVQLTTRQLLLGSAALDPDAYRKYMGKAFLASLGVTDGVITEPAEEQSLGTVLGAEALEREVALLPDADEEDLENHVTGFLRVRGEPVLHHHVIKGFFKETAGHLRRDKEGEWAKVPAYKEVITGQAFVWPTNIAIQMPEGSSPTLARFPRPLQTNGPQGRRTAVAVSEYVPRRSQLTFLLQVLAHKVLTEELLRELLDYGYYMGLGQYRGASYGAFEYDMIEIDGAQARAWRTELMHLYDIDATPTT